VDKLLNPDIGLAIWTISTFLILVVVLGKFAWKPLIKVLEEREQGIRRAIDDAQTARSSAEQIKLQLEKELSGARDQANAMIAAAQADARKRRDQLMSEAEGDARRVIEQARRQLDEERNKAMQEVRKDIARLTLVLTEKVLGQPAVIKEPAALVDSVLADLERSGGRSPQP
jgi:F-type H+-transporting ATPase subunit b